MVFEKWTTWFIRIGLICALIWFGSQLLDGFKESLPFLSSVLWPILVAWFLRVLFLPLIQRLEKKSVPRNVGTLLIFSLLMCLIWLLVIHAIPLIIHQWQEWQVHMPNLSVRAQQWVDGMQNESNLPNPIQRGLSQALEEADFWVSDWVKGLVERLPETISGFLLFLMVPFLLFYFLKGNVFSEQRMSKWDAYPYLRKWQAYFQELEQTLGDYVRGQLLVCVLIGVVAYFAYRLFHVPEAFLLAAFVAVFNIIPYVGPFISMIPAWMVASTVSLQMVIYVTVINLICQIFEGYILSPWILARAIDLHPVWVMLALLVGAEGAGIWGLILAVPILIIFKISFKHAHQYWMEKKGKNEEYLPPKP